MRAWIFVFKTILAALLALWLAMRFDLSAPYTAMLSVFIVMRPQSGLVLAKSFYRMIGTLTGAAMALLLYALFPQQRVLFLASMGIWVALCTMGTQRYRNFAAYAFVLAGYTTCIIGLPASSNPNEVFDDAVARASEVILGVLCAGLISDGLFPNRLAGALDLKIQQRYRQLIEFSEKALTAPLDPAELYRVDQVFVADVIQLESQRSSMVFENAEIRVRGRQVLRLNHEFMATSTALRRLINWMNSLQGGEAIPASDAEQRARLARIDQTLRGFYTRLAPYVHIGPGQPGEQALALAGRLAHFYRELPEAVAVERWWLDESPEEIQADFEQAVQLLGDFVVELWRYSLSYAAFCGLPSPRALRAPASSYVQARPSPLANHNDIVVELLAGARTLATLALTSSLWIAAAWPSGSSAVVLGVVFSALYSAEAAPVHILGQMFRGFILSTVLGFLCYTLVLPRMDGFFQLGLGLLPFLMLGCYLITRPSWTTSSSGFFILFCNGLAIRNIDIHYDTAAYLNAVLADLLAVAAVSTVYSALIPISGRWLRRRAHLGMRKEIEQLCLAAEPEQIGRFESAMRDILYRLLSYPALSQTQLRASMDEVQFQIDLGRTIAEIRQLLASRRWPVAWQLANDVVLARLRSLCQQPDHAHAQMAIASLRDFEQVLQGPVLRVVSIMDLPTARRLSISVYHLRRLLQAQLHRL